MPFKFLKSLGIITFGFVIGYTSVKYLISSDAQNRFPSSVHIAKMGQARTAQYFFTINANHEQIAQNDQQVSTLQIRITALKNIKPGLQFRWNLPSDVEIVEGELNGSIISLTSQQTQDFTLKVKGFSKQKQKYISFEIFGDSDLGPIKRDVLLSSRIEDTFEHQIRKNALNDSGSENYKLNTLKNKFSEDRVVK